MQAILLFHHGASLRHDTGPGHPERPGRVGAVVAGARRVPGVAERSAPKAAREHLVDVHPAGYVDALADFCAQGGGHLDADTVVVPASWEAALRSAGGGIAAIEAVGSGDAGVAFIVSRPPGHHALAERAMGFCLLNNAAIAAQRLTRGGGRVAIVDWDVHHGNGTQDIFYERDDVLYVSLHEFPFYPGTGWVEEKGSGRGRGFTVNVALPEGSGGLAYEEAFDRVVDPVLAGFDPDWVVVSAGYDAHAADPLAGLALEADDYGWMAHRVAGLGRPLLFFLEGGYDLEALEKSVEATLVGASGGRFTASGGEPSRMSRLMVDEAARAAADRWKTVQEA